MGGGGVGWGGGNNNLVSCYLHVPIHPKNTYSSLFTLLTNNIILVLEHVFRKSLKNNIK